MSARGKQPAASEPTERQLAEQHERRLVRCKQECRPVIYGSKKQFIAGIHWHKGDTEAVVYLEGSAEPVKPADITFIKEPE